MDTLDPVCRGLCVQANPKVGEIHRAACNRANMDGTRPHARWRSGDYFALALNYFALTSRAVRA